MIRTSKFNFQWFEPEDWRRALRASVNAQGQLHIGSALKEALPADIVIGFDTKNRVLAIANGFGNGRRLPKGGFLTMRNLAGQLVKLGLTLPISFLFEYDTATAYWIGAIEPARLPPDSSAASGNCVYDMERLLSTHRFIIDNAVYQYAKTTPLEERRAIATEAFFLAVRSYKVGYGDLCAYLKEQVKLHMMRENKLFTAAATYERASMDAPYKSGNRDANFCRYDVTADNSGGGIEALEEQIMEEQFKKRLTRREEKLYAMLLNGYQLAQIADALKISEKDIEIMGLEIGRKRQSFYQAA